MKTAEQHLIYSLAPDDIKFLKKMNPEIWEKLKRAIRMAQNEAKILS